MTDKLDAPPRSAAPPSDAPPADEPVEAEPAPAENELRCTLCGLRACWTG